MRRWPRRSRAPGKEGNPTWCGYSATKAAVIGFTKSAGKEVATEGIGQCYDASGGRATY